MQDLHRFNLLGNSERFQHTCKQIHKLASVDASVLIHGETGTGKEMAARAIHYLGKRAGKPFIPINCGALAETLIESELFGHERGAFTDAKLASAGLISDADGGTLFLDEVDSLSLKAQTALLRFLQDKTYRRVGSSSNRQADVRILVATNAKLEHLVEQKHFRRDLLYRLNVLVLTMPPLRDRGNDAVLLTESFLARFSREYQKPLKTLHPDSISYLQSHAWPGNIRELENSVLREFLMSDSAALHLNPNAEAITLNDKMESPLSFKDAKARAIAEFERSFVAEQLKRTNGNISRAASFSGQDRSAFGKLAKKYGLNSCAYLHTSEASD